MKIIFTLMLALSAAAEARLTDGQFDVYASDSVIQIIPKKNFHLNAEAPASLYFDEGRDAVKPEIKKEHLFQFKNLNTAKKAKLSFYICDDKKTVCEKQDVESRISSLAQPQNQNSADIKEKAQKTQASPKPQMVFNGIEEVSLKSHDERPTLLIFSAPWCPPCLRMVTETYPQKSVRAEFKKINVFKLNTDLPANTELADQFKVRAIPTIVLLDKNGNEAYRWLDFQEASSFSKTLRREVAQIGKAQKLQMLAEQGDQDSALALGLRAFRALEYADAVKWLSRARSEEAQKFKLAAEVGLAAEKADEDEKLSADYLQTLEKAITLTTSDLDRMRWTLDYLDKKKELKQSTAATTAKASALAREFEMWAGKSAQQQRALFLNATYGDYTGFETAELIWLKGKSQLVADSKDEVEKTKKQLLKLILAKNANVNRPGEMLMIIGYMRDTGEVKKVNELYEKLVKAYPNTYVYFEKYARFAQKQKNLELAEKLVNQALQHSQGNLPQLNLLKSQILSELNKKAEALDLVKLTLARDDIKLKKYKRILKQLEELRTNLENKLNHRI